MLVRHPSTYFENKNYHKLSVHTLTDKGSFYDSIHMNMLG